MSKTNCINCGAEKEVSDLQCPFCGTKYTDLSTIDLFSEQLSDQPLFIQMKWYNGQIITAKAHVTWTKIKMCQDTSCLYDADGNIREQVNAMNVAGSIDLSLVKLIH